MKNFLVLFLLSLNLNLIAVNPLQNDLTQVDSLLLQRNEFVTEKENKIANLKKLRNNAKTLSEKYSINNLIYQEYKVYDSDSAYHYLEYNREIATQEHNRGWEASTKIEQSFVLSVIGFLQESLDLMKSINPSDLPRPLLSDYYGQMMFLYARFRDYSSGDIQVSGYYNQKRTEYLDSAYKVTVPGESRYLRCRAWKYMGKPEIVEVKQALLEKLKKEVSDTRDYATDAYMVGIICRNEGDEEGYLRFLALAAKVDIKMVNGESAALQELAQYLHEKGDIDRAYSYLSYCSKNAQLYRNRIRSIQVANLQNTIHQSYQELNEEQMFYLRVFVLIICLLFAALFFILRQMKRIARTSAELKESNLKLNDALKNLSKTQVSLEEANGQLKNLNGQLQDVNGQLRESNYVKEQYIGYVFNICSSLISKLDDFRKGINRKLRVGQIEEAKLLTDFHSSNTNELKEFYRTFDQTFLDIYPNFIKDFNALLQPEEKIELKDGELLNTELRIYALVRLGITDSVKIAEFLHCSSQTVYNKRLQTRNKAVIPKEEFASAVKRLGKMK